MDQFDKVIGYEREKEELFNEFCNGWFDANFDKKAEPRILFKNDSSENGTGYDTSMAKKYDSYGGNGLGSVFVYQYFNIIKEKRKYNVVFDEIKKYLQKAREIIESRCFA